MEDRELQQNLSGQKSKNAHYTNKSHEPPKRKAEVNEDQPPTSKRAAKRMKQLLAGKVMKSDQYGEVNEEEGINESIGKMDNRLMADYIAKQVTRFEPKLTALELEERRIPERALVDTSGWVKKRDLEGLPAFLEHFSGKSQDELTTVAPETKGAPHTIVVAAAGQRSADLIRSLRVYQSASAVVAKLFAKHIKLKEAISSTKNTRMNIGVGTPQRLLDLIEQDSLSLQFVERILIDASHVNTKKRGILDMEESEVPLSQLLALQQLKAGYVSETGRRVKVLLY